MIFDGIKFRRSRLYSWRYGDPERDIDLEGNPVSSNYVVLVSRKDCPIYIKDGRDFLSTEGASQAVKLAYSSNNMGYGKNRHYDDRVTCPVFLVYDAVVYQGTISTPINVFQLRQ